MLILRIKDGRRKKIIILQSKNLSFYIHTEETVISIIKIKKIFHNTSKLI